MATATELLALEDEREVPRAANREIRRESDRDRTGIRQESDREPTHVRRASHGPLCEGAGRPLRTTGGHAKTATERGRARAPARASLRADRANDDAGRRLDSPRGAGDAGREGRPHVRSGPAMIAAGKGLGESGHSHAVNSPVHLDTLARHLASEELTALLVRFKDCAGRGSIRWRHNHSPSTSGDSGREDAVALQEADCAEHGVPRPQPRHDHNSLSRTLPCPGLRSLRQPPSSFPAAGVGSHSSQRTRTVSASSRVDPRSAGRRDRRAARCEG